MYLPDGRIRWPFDRVEWPAPFAKHKACYPHGYLHRRLRKGLGLGSGAEYLPWIRVKIKDFSSIGHSERFNGIVVGRRHHTLSLGETVYFLLQERNHNVIDMREQWPILDMNAVLKLQHQLGANIPHERGLPSPPTIDLMLTERIDGRLHYRAAGIKLEDDAKDPQTIINLQLQRLWCEQQGIPWTLIEGVHDEELYQHLMYIRGWHTHGFDRKSPWIEDFATVFLRMHRPNVRLMDMLEQVGGVVGLSDQAKADLTFRFCVWTDRIPLDKFAPVGLNKIVRLRRR